MSHKLVSLYIGDGEYYTRTDADAVIAELKADYKDACDRLQTANLIKDEQLAATRHHKFKRCLDKAELCELWYYRTKDLHRTKDIEDKYYMGSPLFKKRLFKLWLYEKWTNKWLELAEQFKDKEA